MTSVQSKVIKALTKRKRQAIGLKKLFVEAGLQQAEEKEYQQLMKELVQTGKVYEYKHSYVLSKNMGYMVGTIVKVTQGFGFAAIQDENRDIFIPGRAMMGAMPDDLVLLRNIPSRGERPEAEVIKLLQIGQTTFTGVLVKQDGRTYVRPDKGAKIQMEVSPRNLLEAKEGDKVLAEISRRGQSHFDHKVIIKEVFGSSLLAYNCCKSIIHTKNISTEFSEETILEAQRLGQHPVPAKEMAARLDLRDCPIFTIDSADSKDLDDAISIKKTPEGYELGVHIADVSYYVTKGSALDKEAYERGTSVYFANEVIPMLPQELSNGICSLNPDEDRLAFSALIQLDEKGKLQDYSFHKSIIRSVVKGVYSEINALLANNAPPALQEKYSAVLQELPLMEKLANILMQARTERGSMDLESTESKIILNEEGRPIGIVARERGFSEQMIEEFMLTANTACAAFGIREEVPFIYRVHDKPSEEKMEGLQALFRSLGLTGMLKEGESKQERISSILQEVKGKPMERLVNNQILRSMAKAVYAMENIGHYGLVLDHYTHFTSPIRRYPDLLAHRIMGNLLAGANKEKMCRLNQKFLPEACTHCTQKEIKAMQAERDCSDCYKAEYMLSHVGDVFSGVISSIVAYGLYVHLENSVEGLIHLDNMPVGEYIFDNEKMELLERFSMKRYCIGETLSVLVLGAHVSNGNVDFALSTEKPNAQ